MDWLKRLINASSSDSPSSLPGKNGASENSSTQKDNRVAIGKIGRQPSIDSCLEVSPEQLEDGGKQLQQKVLQKNSDKKEEMAGRATIQEIIGKVDDFGDQFVVLLDHQGKAYKIPTSRFPHDDLNLKAYYKCRGKSDEGIFHVESIEVLRGTAQLEEMFRRKKPIAAPFNLLSGNPKVQPTIMNLFNVPTSAKAVPSQPLASVSSSDESTSKQSYKTVKTEYEEQESTDSYLYLDATDEEFKPGKSSKLHQVEENSSNSSTIHAKAFKADEQKDSLQNPLPQFDKLNLKEAEKPAGEEASLNPSKAAAIVVALDKKGGETVLMFSPERGLFKFPIQCLEQPVHIGQWFAVGKEAEKEEDENQLENCEPARKLDEKPPMMTRFSNGSLQFFTEATLSQVTAAEGSEQEGGDDGTVLLCCHSAQFLRQPIVDSSCFLTHLWDKNALYEASIRNGPKRKVKVWCAIRKFPLGGFQWKVVGLDPAFRKKRPKSTLSKMASTTLPEPAKKTETGKQEDLAQGRGSDGKQKESMVIKVEGEPRRGPTKRVHQQLEEDPNAIHDGLICALSANATDYIVYCPMRRAIAYMECRGKNHRGGSMLGMWIQFKMHRINGRPMVVDHRLMLSPMNTLPSKDAVLICCQIEVPRPLESTLSPCCPKLGIDVADKHQLLKQQHRGRSLKATISCAYKQPLEEQLEWVIAYVEDE